jgi:hypothetical protein
MTKIKIVPLDFMGQGACLQPVNQKLHDLTVAYCREELQNGEQLNLSLLNKVFVAVELDEHEAPVKVHGISGVQMRVDIPLFRATHSLATTKLHQRLHSYLADQGILGQEVFIHLSSKELPEQRCEGWEAEVEAAQLTPADRLLTDS